LIQRHRNPSLERRIVATLDKEKYYFKDNLCCLITKEGNAYSLNYILAIINSKMMNYYYKKNFTEVSLNPIYLRRLPIHKIESKNKTDVNTQIKLENLVTEILTAKRLNPQADTSALEAEIDRLVYGLYGLKEEEIKIVEGKG
jgi:hypothetical protein